MSYMHDKVKRNSNRDENKGKQKRSKKYRYNVWRFLCTQKSKFVTGTMLVLMMALLVGIGSQLPPPSTSVVPNGETSLDYSTFLQQVNDGNVLGVIVQEKGINGLLMHPVGINTKTAKNRAQDYVAWDQLIRGENASWMSMQATPAIDPRRAVYVQMPVSGDAALMPLLLHKQAKVDILPGSQANWGSLLWLLLPILMLLLLPLLFLIAHMVNRRRNPMNERMIQMGKSLARRVDRVRGVTPSSTEAKRPTPMSKAGHTDKARKSHISTLPRVTFADVAGIDEVRTELEEIVQFLHSPERFHRLGAHIPRGALLVGPPGTGKTLLARAVAGEADVPFFRMSASEFVEMFVGVGASRVRDLFKQARQVAPCVVFIDELNAVGRKRSSMRASNNDERDQTLNQLLVEMDGFDTQNAVVVLAATNRVDILDAALLRPGRFDRRISVSLPDRAGREAILKVHTRNTPLHEDVSLQRLARMTTGMSGADLANLINEAALVAARRNMEDVGHECFEEALARVQLGALRPIVMSEKDRRIIAYHEGGHALVAHHLPEADGVNRVTILPRGQSLGVTQFVAEEDRYNYSRAFLMARIAVGLGGRVAEELTFGPDCITTGAENDLQMVTDLARRMVTRWGMSEQVGLVFADDRVEGNSSLNMRRLESDTQPSQARALAINAKGHLQLDGHMPAHHHTFAVETSAVQNTHGVMMNALIDAEVQRILNDGRAVARALLMNHTNQLVLLAQALMEHEQLDRTQFETLLNA